MYPNDKCVNVVSYDITFEGKEGILNRVNTENCHNTVRDNSV